MKNVAALNLKEAMKDEGSDIPSIMWAAKYPFRTMQKVACHWSNKPPCLNRL